MNRFGVGMLFLCGLLLGSLTMLAHAQDNTVTAYKCISAQGQVTYQGAPCKHDQKQQTLQLDDNEPGTPPAQADENDTQQTAATPAPRPPVPTTPPSLMYRCTRATDGKTYLSNNGNPAPYYAPLAMTGIIPTPLGQTSPRVTANAAMVASHYTQVQDQCQPMSPQDTCSELRSQYDDTEKKLSRAFKSDQLALQQRESELLAELSHC
ncbi:DUF4124 domain-containing protein [Dyella dinghuensis]|uniref:DUF4124 domain-containing protein n=1 Tax=Dyella dinghuensis TaxID=1920169 RepID=A0A432LTP4_9GAMM|nr:DUF4124 domain-containing protein [Dyella dinghuensis]RUL64361.1 DUF4124 domain-containing protein [Dyella dinghuensis]